MRVLITGGTGLIGSRLVRRLRDRGDEPVVLTRRASALRDRPDYEQIELVQGDPALPGGWELAVDGCDAVVNLVGHNIFAQRWSPKVKQEIRDSRVNATQRVVAAIANATHQPKVLVQGSAIGYYGPTGDEELTEASPAGSDFLANVCVEWENAARPAEKLGLRVPIVRIGIVLEQGAGALGFMTPIFKYGLVGTPVGSGGRPLPGRGRQWMSWIHLEDIVGLILTALDHPDASGPINGTAPNPVRNVDFSKALAKVMRRPFVPLGPPDFVLHAMLGEVAEIITTGQRVLPNRARELGHTFQYPEVLPALRSLLHDGRKGRPSETTTASP